MASPIHFIKAIWNSFGVHISGTWRWCLTGVESAHSLPTLTQACVRRRFFPFFNMFIIYIYVIYIYIYIFHCFTIYLIFSPDSPTNIFLGHPRTLALAAPGPFISEILERPACLCVWECARKKARKGGENPEQFGELPFLFQGVFRWLYILCFCVFIRESSIFEVFNNLSSFVREASILYNLQLNKI